MKNFKKVIAGALMLTMLLSFTACGKKVAKIDEDDLMDAMEERFDWDEGEEYREHEDYEFWGTNFDDVDDPYIYELDYYLQGYESDDYDVYISYAIFDDQEEAEEYFGLYYDAFAVDHKDVKKNYVEGECGWFLDANDKDFFHAYYYADDMVLEVSAYDEDSVKELRALLKSFDYPNK